jgi:small-conductance mechanosensitive channel
MSIDTIILNKLAEIKKELLSAIAQIQTAGILNIILTLVISVLFYFLAVFVIKILTRKFDYLQEIRSSLKKLFFYFLFFLFWKQLSGGFASLMANIGLFFFMLKLLKISDYIIVDVFMARHARGEVQQIFRDIIKAVVWVVIILIMLKGIFGFSVQDIAITSAVMTAAIGFAFQDTLVNIISGISIIVEKTFKIGDVIQLKSGELGVVIQINWRTTRIKNRKNQVVVLPNKELANSELINYNYYNQIARIFTVGVAYHNPPGYVKKCILEYLQAFPEVLKVPPPEVFVTGYNDFSIEYQIRFFITDFEHAFQIEDKVKTGIWYLFKRNNIEIPFPIRNIYLHQAAEKKETEPPGRAQMGFSAGENILVFLSPDTSIQVEEGILELQDIYTGKVVRELKQGERIYLAREFFRALKDDFLLTSHDAKIRILVEGEMTAEEKEEMNRRSEDWIQGIEEELRMRKTTHLQTKREENFINHFLNINFNIKDKKDRT